MREHCTALLCCVLLLACEDDSAAPAKRATSGDGGARASDAGASNDDEPWDDRGEPCSVFDPRAVSLWGIRPLPGTYGAERTEYPLLIPGPGYTRKCYDFAIAHEPVVRAGDGHVLYLADWEVQPTVGVQVWVGDDYDPATRERVRHGDLAVPTPGCDPATTHGVRSFMVQPETGEVFYSCDVICASVDDPACTEVPFFDTRGREVSDRLLLAVTAGGAQLVTCHRDDCVGGYGVRRTGTSVPLPVIDLELSFHDFDTVDRVLRAHGEGFWFVRYKNDGLHDYDAERWYIALSGQARFEGFFDTGELREVFARMLDAQGRLFELQPEGTDRQHRKLVRYELGGEHGETVFSESAQPEGIEITTLRLVTGP